MKKILTFFCLCICLIFAVGCTDSIVTENESVSIADVVIEAAGSPITETEDDPMIAYKEDIDTVEVTGDLKEPEKVEAIEEAEPTDEKFFRCSLLVSCEELINNKELLDKPKRDFVPDDGIILFEEGIAFGEGETVFDVLKRMMEENSIHMEYVSSIAYDSAYIEGINNIYELDAGPASGWTYTVNGEYPMYGSNKYLLCDGDDIVFRYILSY